MKRCFGTSGWWLLSVLCLMLGATPIARAQAASAVPKLDLNRFTGTWYEVARFPVKREKKCVGDVFELIAAAYKPNRISVVNSCETKTPYPEIRNITARQDKDGSGRLKVRTIWPFTRKVWVIGLSPDYTWALTGTPNHKELRVLSRTRSMKPEVLAEVESQAAAEGFAPGKLVMTPQNHH